MKKFLKLTALVLAVVMSAFCFAACSGEKQQPATDGSETGYKGEYDVIKMGTNAAFPPYEYKDGEKFVGIDIDIATAIAEELGATLEVVDMEFDSIITAVDKGEVDLGIAGMTVTDERKEQVDFSASYATGVQSVIVPEGSAIADIDDLSGKKIGVQLGTTGDIYASDDYGEENVTKYAKGADAVIALKGGDVDAVIIDNEPAKAFVEANEGLVILDTDYAIEDYAIAIKKGNTDLLDDVNAALEKLTAEGKIDEIIANYIKAE